MFEYVYFARPDSIFGGVNVGKVRTEMGRELARRFPVKADIVVPVPDSGNYAALGFAEELKIPFRARVRSEPLHRAHIFAAEPAHSRFRRAREIEFDQGNGGGKTRGRGGRFNRARHHGAGARGESARGRCERSAHARQLSATSVCLPLRHRFS